MRLFKPQFKDKTGKWREISKWHCELRDHFGILRRFAGFTDKAVTEEFARKLEKLIALRVAGEQPDISLTRWLEMMPGKLRERLGEIGIIDASRAAGGKPLSELIARWREYLSDKECTPKYVKLAATRAQRVFDECHFSTWTDISCEKVQRWLAERRDKGLSFQSSNHYRGNLRAFCNWQVQTGRASENPLRNLQGVNAKIDRRYIRRALSDTEKHALIEAAQNGKPFKRMSGPHRALVYRVALTTGLRAAELASLTWQDFQLDTDNPVVVVRAAASKHRREDTLPLRRDIAEALSEWKIEHDNDNKVFPLSNYTAKMLRIDLTAAGVPVRDVADEIADFHSLRHTFCTDLCQAKVHPAVIQRLARHSDINLTLSRYSHPAIPDLREAVNNLPDFSQPIAQEMQATGTYGSDLSKNLAGNLAFLGGQKRTVVDSSAQVDGRNSESNDARKASKHAGKPTVTSTPEEIRPDRLKQSTCDKGNRYRYTCRHTSQGGKYGEGASRVSVSLLPRVFLQRHIYSDKDLTAGGQVGT